MHKAILTGLIVLFPLQSVWAGKSAAIMRLLRSPVGDHALGRIVGMSIEQIAILTLPQKKELFELSLENPQKPESALLAYKILDIAENNSAPAFSVSVESLLSGTNPTASASPSTHALAKALLNPARVDEERMKFHRDNILGAADMSEFRKKKISDELIERLVTHLDALVKRDKLLANFAETVNKSELPPEEFFSDGDDMNIATMLLLSANGRQIPELPDFLVKVREIRELDIDVASAELQQLKDNETGRLFLAMIPFVQLFTLPHMALQENRIDELKKKIQEMEKFLAWKRYLHLDSI